MMYKSADGRRTFFSANVIPATLYIVDNLQYRDREFEILLNSENPGILRRDSGWMHGDRETYGIYRGK